MKDGIDQREPLGAVIAALPSGAVGGNVPAEGARAPGVSAGQDRFGEPGGLEVSTIEVKVGTTDSSGAPPESRAKETKGDEHD